MSGLEASMSMNGGTAVVVLGHGSRAPEAQLLLEWVAGRLATRLDTPVMAASLQFNEPTLEDCCRELAAAGATRVIVTPYFLFMGNHLQKDIPGVLEQLRGDLPETEIILAESLGADELLVEVLAKRTLATGNEEAETAAALDGAAGPGDAADVLGAFLAGGCASCEPMPQHPIEAESFAIIDSLLEPEDPTDPEYQVARRIVHTTGDPSLARSLVFSPGAVGAGITAIDSGTQIFCDVNMVASGIAPTAKMGSLQVVCLVADPEVARIAQQEGLTRGAAAVRQAARGDKGAGALTGDVSGQRPATAAGLDGAIIAIGNAPTALFELLRLVEEEGARPALVIGVPVGFVGAAESKEALAASSIPHITLPGNRGGSSAAAAAVNALIRLHAGRGFR